MSEELDENQELENPEGEETPETNEKPEAKPADDFKLKEVLAQKKHWREKAEKEAGTRKKLEEEVEKLRSSQKQDKGVPPQDFITKDEYQEGILRTSKNYTDEDITTLNVIAKGRGISLFQAEQDDMFKHYLERKAEEDKMSKAQLGASKGSPESGGKKEPATREEHMEMWKEKTGL